MTNDQTVAEAIDKTGDIPQGVHPLDFFKPNAVIPSPPDARDHQFVSTVAAAALPTKAMVDEFPAQFQGGKGSCACFSMGSMLAGGYRLAGAPFDPSEEYLYARGREIHDGWLCQDTGTVPRELCDLLVREGMLTEVERPYTMDLCQGTTAQERASAGAHKAAEYFQAQGLQGIKQAVVEGRRVCICMTLRSNFQPDAQGLIPMPSGPVWGGHCMVIVGYDDTLFGGCLIVMNSWGRSWGIEGMCYIPYTFLNMGVDVGGVWMDDLWVLKVAGDTKPKPEPRPEPAPGLPLALRHFVLRADGSAYDFVGATSPTTLEAGRFHALAIVDSAEKIRGSWVFIDLRG